MGREGGLLFPVAITAAVLVVAELLLCLGAGAGRRKAVVCRSPITVTLSAWPIGPFCLQLLPRAIELDPQGGSPQASELSSACSLSLP